MYCAEAFVATHTNLWGDDHSNQGMLHELETSDVENNNGKGCAKDALWLMVKITRAERGKTIGRA